MLPPAVSVIEAGVPALLRRLTPPVPESAPSTNDLPVTLASKRSEPPPTATVLFCTALVFDRRRLPAERVVVPV